MENKIECPKCSSTQILAHKRGWNLTTGMIGANAIKITCLNCSNRFSPNAKKPQTARSPELIKTDIRVAKILFKWVLMPMVVFFIFVGLAAIFFS